MPNEPILCYVYGGAAYFTTQALDRQWADDWGDSPYEHNAGEPYHWRLRDTAIYLIDGEEKTWEELRAEGLSVPSGSFLRREPIPEDQQDPKWEITKVYFEGPFRQPCDGHLNSPYSVQQINAGAVAWLSTHSYAKEAVVIPAGTTLDDFIALVQKAGGDVYMRVEP